MTGSRIHGFAQGVDGTVARTGRVTFSNADYVAASTDTYIAQVGALTATRTITLPAASSVVGGYPIVVADEAYGITASFSIVIACAGADTVLNPVDKLHTTTQIIHNPGGSMRLVSNGVSQWTVTAAGEGRPASWWLHPRDIAIPSGVWTPIPFGSTHSTSPGIPGTDPYGISGMLTPFTASTTVTVASNGVALPTATINVTSTSGFLSEGYLTITGPPASGVDTIVHYTGVTASTFTGCNTLTSRVQNNISTGTLATSQVVRQAVVDWTYPMPGYVMCVLDVAFEFNSTGARGVRFRSVDGAFNFAGSTQHAIAIPAASLAGETGQHLQCCMQSAPSPGGGDSGSRTEAFQSSGGVLRIETDGIQSPSLMQIYGPGFAR